MTRPDSTYRLVRFECVADWLYVGNIFVVKVLCEIFVLFERIQEEAYVFAVLLTIVDRVVKKTVGHWVSWSTMKQWNQRDGILLEQQDTVAKERIVLDWHRFFVAEELGIDAFHNLQRILESSGFGVQIKSNTSVSATWWVEEAASSVLLISKKLSIGNDSVFANTYRILAAGRCIPRA